MERPDAALDPALERSRLDECAREPIRVPGRIQSHGQLLGIESATGVITLASENAAEWLGRSVDELQSVSLADAIREANPVDPVRITLDGDEFESILRFWLDRGVDGFRIDVAHGLYQTVGLLARRPQDVERQTLRTLRADAGKPLQLLYET